MNLTQFFCTFLGIASVVFGADEQQATFNLKVVDDNQQPVKGAEVYVAFQAYHRDRHHEMFLKTGDDGTLKAVGWPKDKFLHSVYTKISKPGYHTSIKEYTARPDDRAWDVQMLLREERKPIPMYARSVDIELPVLRKEVGFDLKKGEWVKPYGKGEKADCTFIGTKIYQDRDNYSVSVIMSFPGLDCGLQPDASFNDKAIQVSRFKSTRMAPNNGYNPLRKFDANKSSEEGYAGTTDKASYIYKSRPTLGFDGQVVSYHYGKLIDAVDVQMGAGLADKKPIISFTYYFNPTPNDRNLEFDPKQNLFKDLKPDEQVHQP